MKFKLADLIHWLPRGLALFIFFYTAIFLFFSPILGFAFLLKLLISSSFLLTTLIAWRSEAIGGSVFIILSSLCLIAAMGTQLSLVYFSGLPPLFVTGGLFMVDHFYQEKKMREDNGEL